jgi:DNA-binding IclR family transcriptional regulator
MSGAELGSQADVLAQRLKRCSPRTVVNRTVLRRQLDDVVERGYAFEHEESAVGITSVAAPVLDEHDLAIAGVSVTGPVGRFQPARGTQAPCTPRPRASPPPCRRT